MPSPVATSFSTKPQETSSLELDAMIAEAQKPKITKTNVGGSRFKKYCIISLNIRSAVFSLKLTEKRELKCSANLQSLTSPGRRLLSPKCYGQTLRTWPYELWLAGKLMCRKHIQARVKNYLWKLLYIKFQQKSTKIEVNVYSVCWNSIKNALHFVSATVIAACYCRY